MVTPTQMVPTDFDREDFLANGRFDKANLRGARELNAWMIERHSDQFSDQMLWQFGYRITVTKRVNLTYRYGTGAAWMDFLSCNRGSWQLLPVIEFAYGSLYVTSGRFETLWNTGYLIQGDGMGFPWFDAWPLLDLFIADIGSRMGWGWEEVERIFEIKTCKSCGACVKPMPAKNAPGGMCWQCSSALPII